MKIAGMILILMLPISSILFAADHDISSGGKNTPVTEEVRSNPLSGKPYTNALGMMFVYIKPGTFMMGSPICESNRDNDENLHQVTLTKGYWMQTTEVTQAQWQAVMGENPSRHTNCGGDCPVEHLTWDDAQAFIRKLNRRGGKMVYRLPTEAQWEYAARAGSSDRFCFGDSDSRLGDHAWYSENSENKTHPVGQKAPNAWGLYDMHGNVWEWCRDWFGDYPSGFEIDPAGPSSGTSRVLRGGSWFNFARSCRSANRYWLRMGFGLSDGGLRLVASPVNEPAGGEKTRMTKP